MIITDKFVWFHFPKTAGTTTYFIFNQLIKNHIVFQHDLLDGKRKHMTLKEFKQEFEEYDHLPKVIGYRNLPEWLYSRNRHMAARLIEKNTLIDKQKLLEIIEYRTRNGLCPKHGDKIGSTQDKHWQSADAFINKFDLRYETIPSLTIIRYEYFLKDLSHLLEKYYGLSALNSNIKENVNKTFLPTKLNQQDIEKIYRRNPLWSKIESKIYEQSKIN